VEFAITMPLIVVTMIGSMEIARVLFASALLEGALREASRYGITGQGASADERLDTIRRIVDFRSLGLVEITPEQLDSSSYPSFDAIGLPEPFIDTYPFDGVYVEGEPFTDINENGTWDLDQGRGGAGREGEVVVYRVQATLPAMSGYIARLLGGDEAFGLTASIAVRNEPWGNSQVSE
jgi:hypothetical protein